MIEIRRAFWWPTPPSKKSGIIPKGTNIILSNYYFTHKQNKVKCIDKMYRLIAKLLIPTAALINDAMFEVVQVREQIDKIVKQEKKLTSAALFPQTH